MSENNNNMDQNNNVEEDNKREYGGANIKNDKLTKGGRVLGILGGLATLLMLAGSDESGNSKK